LQNSFHRIRDSAPLAFIQPDACFGQRFFGFCLRNALLTLVNDNLLQFRRGQLSSPDGYGIGADWTPYTSNPPDTRLIAAQPQAGSN